MGRNPRDADTSSIAVAAWGTNGQGAFGGWFEMARIAPRRAGGLTLGSRHGPTGRQTPFRRCFGPIRSHLLMKSDYPRGIGPHADCCIHGPHLA